MEKEEIRRQVKALKGFYMNILGFVLGNALFTFIWFAFDRSGTFWPKYIFLVWGAGLIIEACRKNIFSFLTPEWEERKIKELSENPSEQHRIQLNRHRKKEI